MYGKYNLTELEIPRNALPQPDRPNKGTHSYTICKGGKVIEVLLQKKSFYVRGDGSSDFPKGASTQFYTF